LFFISGIIYSQGLKTKIVDWKGNKMEAIDCEICFKIRKEVSKESPYDALDMANLYYESNLTKYAEPNFYLINYNPEIPK
jgi:hypothetical protein